MERIAVACSTSKIDHSGILNKRDGSDVTINVAGKLLYAHRAIVEIRCPNLFLNAVKKKTIKKATVFLDVEDKKGVMTPKAFTLFLKFLYSSNVKFFGMDPIEVMELMVIAKTYECHNLLKLCQLFLLCIVDEGKWFNILKESRRLELDEATCVAKMFAKENFPDLVIQKQGMVALGIDLFHEIVEFVVLPQPDSSLEDLNTVITASHVEIQEDFERICTEMFRADATFLTSKEPLLFHSFVVFNQSTKLIQLFAPESSTMKLSSKYDEVSDEALVLLLKFLYYAYDQFDPFISYQLSQFSLDFSLSLLHQLCERNMHLVDSKNAVRAYHIAKEKIVHSQTGSHLEHLKTIKKLSLTTICEKFDVLDTNQIQETDLLVDLLVLAQKSAATHRWRTRKRPFRELSSRLEQVQQKKLNRANSSEAEAPTDVILDFSDEPKRERDGKTIKRPAFKPKTNGSKESLSNTPKHPRLQKCRTDASASTAPSRRDLGYVASSSSDPEIPTIPSEPNITVSLATEPSQLYPAVKVTSPDRKETKKYRC